MQLPTPSLMPFSAGAAIFDFDGTLADTASLWYDVDATFLARRGIPYEDDYPTRLAALGFVDGARYTIERYNLHETVEEVCTEWTELGRELYATTVCLRPGAERYVRTLLASDVPCALATTNDPAVLGAMELVDVYGLFDACVHGVEVGRGKDFPDIYFEAARRLRVEPGACMVFEDIVPAALSAKRAGMVVCGVRANDPRQDVEGLMRASDLWLDDWSSIPC